MDDPQHPQKLEILLSTPGQVQTHWVYGLLFRKDIAKNGKEQTSIAIAHGLPFCDQ